MLKHCIILITLWILILTNTSALTVVSWNLQWFPGKSPEPTTAEQQSIHLKSAQSVLKQLNPDIFIAQEIRDRSSFETLIEVVPNLRCISVTAFRDPDQGALSKQQIAIASKLKSRTAWSESWRPTMSNLDKGFLVTALELPDTKSLLIVYGVHFKSNRSKSDREAQSNFRLRNEQTYQILMHQKELERLVFSQQEIKGWIIAGDLNTNHDQDFGDQVLQQITQAGFFNTWATITKKNRLTWVGNDQFPANTFDYILTKNLPSSAATLHKSALGASDHLPVILSIK